MIFSTVSARSSALALPVKASHSSRLLGSSKVSQPLPFGRKSGMSYTRADRACNLRRAKFPAARSPIRLARPQAEAMADSVSALELPPLPQDRIVVGCGGAGMDYLATVTSYPQPDDKIRTTDLEVQGGGNVGNALTAAARLGLTPRIVTKVADDALGQQIVEELQEEGVDTSHMVIAKDGVSPFTYIIVDRESSTRTCIHTAGTPPLLPSEVDESAISAVLADAALVYFDGRLAETAIKLAREASARGLPILLDAERPREGLDDLLALADYVITSSKFPTNWTGAGSLGEALLSIAQRLPHVKFVITTLGGKGCVMLDRRENVPPAGSQNEALDADELLESLQHQAASRQQTGGSGPVVETSELVWLRSKHQDGDEAVAGRLVVGTAAELAPEEVVDTTGAGDAFIGATLYALCAGLQAEQLLQLATTVAGTKCTQLGARPGLPRRNNPRLAGLL